MRTSLRAASKDRLFLLGVCVISLINNKLHKLTKQCVKVNGTKKLSGWKPTHKLSVWKVY